LTKRLPDSARATCAANSHILQNGGRFDVDRSAPNTSALSFSTRAAVTTIAAVGYTSDAYATRRFVARDGSILEDNR
jgi:hypothetical protein